MPAIESAASFLVAPAEPHGHALPRESLADVFRLLVGVPLDVPAVRRDGDQSVMTAVVTQAFDEFAPLLDVAVGDPRIRDHGIDSAREGIGTREAQAVPQVVARGFRIAVTYRDGIGLSVMHVDDRV